MHCRYKFEETIGVWIILANVFDNRQSVINVIKEKIILTDPILYTNFLVKQFVIR